MALDACSVMYPMAVLDVGMGIRCLLGDVARSKMSVLLDVC